MLNYSTPIIEAQEWASQPLPPYLMPTPITKKWLHLRPNGAIFIPDRYLIRRPSCARRIIDPQVKMYSSPEPNSLSLATLVEGTEVEFGKTFNKAGKKWTEVIMPSGQKGYIPAETRVYHFRLGALLQNNVPMYNQPSSQSLVRATLKRNTKVYMTDVVKADNQDWVKVRDLTGVEGYIPGQTPIRALAEKSKALARKNMISGALWCIGGIIVTVTTLKAASGGGTYFIAWGAILFGFLQLVQGIYQFFTANS